MKKTPEIHVVAGFLGAGKTTFLNVYLPLLQGRTVVIENEAGTAGVDGALLPEGYPVRELSAGCICCTLAPRLHAQLEEITEEFEPDQIVIEPSGVGNLSDIVRHCKTFGYEPTVQIVMVDASEFEDYADGFGSFYMDQIDNASLILMTHVTNLDSATLNSAVERIKESNRRAIVLESDWRDLKKDVLLHLVEQTKCELELLEHQHHHDRDHDFENNGFEQLMFENIKVWSGGTFDSVVRELKSGLCGEVYRSKGFIEHEDEKIWYFDFTPNNQELTEMSESLNKDDVRFIVIGKNLDKDKLEALLAK